MSELLFIDYCFQKPKQLICWLFFVCLVSFSSLVFAATLSKEQGDDFYQRGDFENAIIQWTTKFIPSTC
jgi:hypothetical protein